MEQAEAINVIDQAIRRLDEDNRFLERIRESLSFALADQNWRKVEEVMVVIALRTME